MGWNKAIKPNLSKIIISLPASIIWYLWLIYKESQAIYDFYCPNLPCKGISMHDLLPSLDCGCITLSQIIFQIAYIVWPSIIAYIIYSFIQKIKK